MSDYLGHLVERSFAPLPAVRPNTPSRFEPSPAKSPVDQAMESDRSIDEKITALREQPADPAATGATRITNEARVANHDAHGQSTGHLRASSREKNSAEAPPPHSPFAAIAPLSPNLSAAPIRAVSPRAVQAVAPANAVAPRPDAELPFSVSARPNATSGNGRFRTNGSGPASSTPRNENGPATARDAAALPATIHVTIGRVEIKATPPAPAPLRPMPRKNPAMSLEIYLLRRSNGGRDE